MKKKAIVLLSGGMDSSVVLYRALEDYSTSVLIFNYGQKASKEIKCAKKISKTVNSEYFVLSIDLPWGGSSLIDRRKEIPLGKLSTGGRIPSTYVPSRNIIFLSYAVSFAETAGAGAVFIGAHQLDFSNYPDCRLDFFKAFIEAIKKGTKSGVEGKAIDIVTPIINFTKKDIVELGVKLKVPFEYTWSCYKNGELPCGVCESCILRRKGFEDAGVVDPLLAKLVH